MWCCPLRWRCLFLRSQPASTRRNPRPSVWPGYLGRFAELRSLFSASHAAACSLVAPPCNCLSNSRSSARCRWSLEKAGPACPACQQQQYRTTRSAPAVAPPRPPAACVNRGHAAFRSWRARRLRPLRPGGTQTVAVVWDREVRMHDQAGQEGRRMGGSHWGHCQHVPRYWCIRNEAGPPQSVQATGTRARLAEG